MLFLKDVGKAKALLGAYVETMMLLFMKNISVNPVAHFSTGEWLSFALVVTSAYNLHSNFDA